MKHHHPLKLALGLLLAFIVIVPGVMMLRAAEDTAPMQSHDFTDVPVSGQEFMEEYIDAFYHQGVTGGCSTSPLQYCPLNAVTRGSMAVFIGRALGYVEAENLGYNTRAYFYNPSLGEAYGVIGRSLSGDGVRGMSILGDGISASTNFGTGVNAASVNGIGISASSEATYGGLIYSNEATGLLVGTGADDPSEDIFDIELAGNNGKIHGQAIYLSSDSNFTVDLDREDNDTNVLFRIRNGVDALLFSVTELGVATINAATTINGNLQINGNYAATGTKTALVNTVSYGTRAMYAVEATEVWFEDFGTAQLVDGEVVIEIDPVFAQTANLAEDYHVFFTPIDGSADLYITARTATSFTVRADDASDIEFSYRIVAKRLGYEEVRMEEFSD